MILPEFPVDDITLDLIWNSIHPKELNSRAESSSLWSCLDFLSAMGGSDTSEVEYTECIDGQIIDIMKNQSYSEHDLISALIKEIRRLRKI